MPRRPKLGVVRTPPLHCHLPRLAYRSGDKTSVWRGVLAGHIWKHMLAEIRSEATGERDSEVKSSPA